MYDLQGLEKLEVLKLRVGFENGNAKQRMIDTLQIKRILARGCFVVLRKRGRLCVYVHLEGAKQKRIKSLTKIENPGKARPSAEDRVGSFKATCLHFSFSINHRQFCAANFSCMCAYLRGKG